MTDSSSRGSVTLKHVPATLRSMISMCPSVLIDDLLDHSESEAHAVSSPRIEHVEESLPVRVANAGALVRNF